MKRRRSIILANLFSARRQQVKLKASNSALTIYEECYIINNVKANIIQWQNTSFPNWIRGFDPRCSLHRLDAGSICVSVSFEMEAFFMADTRTTFFLADKHIILCFFGEITCLKSRQKHIDKFQSVRYNIENHQCE